MLEALERVRRLASSMGSVSAVDSAVMQVCQLFEKAGVPYRLVGGMAVVHHGHIRTTEDIDVLVDASAVHHVDRWLDEFGFSREGSRRLRHVDSGVRVDLLLSGDLTPRQDGRRYPKPQALGSSDRNPAVVDLASLIELKLYGGRYQDLADVVALLKNLDESAYLSIESSLPADLRGRLLELRRDALEELSWG